MIFCQAKKIKKNNFFSSEKLTFYPLPVQLTPFQAHLQAQIDSAAVPQGILLYLQATKTWLFHESTVNALHTAGDRQRILPGFLSGRQHLQQCSTYS